MRRNFHALSLLLIFILNSANQVESQYATATAWTWTYTDPPRRVTQAPVTATATAKPFTSNPEPDIIQFSKKVVCHWIFRNKEALYYLDDKVCTHIVYPCLVVNEDGSVIDRDGALNDFPQIKKRFPTIKFLLSFEEKIQPSKLLKAASDFTSRKTLIQNIISIMHKNIFDGFNLDWGYLMTELEGSKGAFKSFLIAFQYAQNALESQGFSSRLFSITVEADPIQAPNYDFPTINQLVDFINLKTYNLHGHWEGKNGLHSALYFDANSVEVCVNHWIKSGIRPSKLILGIPAYGQSFTLANSGDYENIGLEVTGPGHAGPISKQEGILFYREICKNKWRKMFAVKQRVPYAYNYDPLSRFDVDQDQWVSYDSILSVNHKVDFINARGLGGAMIFSLEFDDYKNECGEGTFPLARTAFNRLSLMSSMTSSSTWTWTWQNLPFIFNCPSNGYFKDTKNCKMFYQCFNGMAIHFSCAEGTCFDSSYGCIYCNQVQC